MMLGSGQLQKGRGSMEEWGLAQECLSRTIWFWSEGTPLSSRFLQ